MRSKPSQKPMTNNKKGLWSPDEDLRLKNFIINHGHVSWNSIPIYTGLQRDGKSCRLRWINYLRPGLKRGPFSLQEEHTILTLHASLGNKWSQISQHLPGRTDNEIKNYWHTYLKKRFAKPVSPPTPKLENHTNSNSSADITNSSSADMDQSVPPVSNISNSPGIQFPDWTSEDLEFLQDLERSTGRQLSHDCHRNEGPADNNETQNYPSSGSSEDMFDSQIANISNSPEIQFPDWTSEDLEFLQDLERSTGRQLSHDCHRNEGPADNNETQNYPSSGSSEDMFDSQIANEQIFTFDVEDFNMDDLFMCI